jgi:cholesterol 7alpha-monooxygenase
VFKYDRFVDATFYKDGKELKNPVMAFGTLCPGRRYAILQMKWYLLNICLRYKFTFASSVRAQFDYRYHGHEVLPPVTDVPVHIEQRENFTTSLQLV